MELKRFVESVCIVHKLRGFQAHGVVTTGIGFSYELLKQQ
jgi:hypothetical protein